MTDKMTSLDTDDWQQDFFQYRRLAKGPLGIQMTDKRFSWDTDDWQKVLLSYRWLTRGTHRVQIKNNRTSCDTDDLGCRWQTRGPLGIQMTNKRTSLVSITDKRTSCDTNDLQEVILGYIWLKQELFGYSWFQKDHSTYKIIPTTCLWSPPCSTGVCLYQLSLSSRPVLLSLYLEICLKVKLTTMTMVVNIALIIIAQQFELCQTYHRICCPKYSDVIWSIWRK